jgi:hypothetical protein
MRKKINYWLENQKGKGHYKKPWHRWEGDIKMDLKETRRLSID